MGYFDDVAKAYTDAFDDAYASAEARRGTADLPDGNYQGFVDEFRLDKSQQGALSLQIKLIVMSEGYAGLAVYRRINIDLEDIEGTARRLKGDLSTLGFDWTGIRSLDDQKKCGDMLDQIVDFKVTHKTGQTRNGESRTYMNVWLNRVCGLVDEETRRFYGATPN